VGGGVWSGWGKAAMTMIGQPLIVVECGVYQSLETPGECVGKNPVPAGTDLRNICVNT